MECKNKINGLDNSQLKMIALISMLIDHVGVGLLTGQTYMLARIIGRLAFPIYCFLLIEGVENTGNKRMYMRNLLVFSVLSEIPFDLVVGTSWETQNVYWTLLLGAALVVLLSRFEHKSTWVLVAAHMMLLIVTMGLSEILRTDYSATGILMIYIMYILKKHRVLQLCASYIVLTRMYLEVWSLPAFVMLGTYNGRRGFIRGKIKYIFYWFYPLHLLVIAVVKYAIAS